VPSAGLSRFRLARSLLVTPWFAAGAGIVIAAALAVNAPAALTYAPNDPGGQQCSARCASTAHNRLPGEVATATPGVVLKTPGAHLKGAGSARPSHRAEADPGDQLGYQIVSRWPSGFVAVITLPGAAKPGAWNLQFGFRAAHVDGVWGARWQPFGGGDGGTASAWPAGEHSPRAPGASSLDARQVAVAATGSPQSPSSCRLDGLTCHFG
jgi:hypothetical protein